jgi:hypothetical protein
VKSRCGFRRYSQTKPSALISNLTNPSPFAPARSPERVGALPMVKYEPDFGRRAVARGGGDVGRAAAAAVAAAANHAARRRRSSVAQSSDASDDDEPAAGGGGALSARVCEGLRWVQRRFVRTLKVHGA